MKFDTTPTLYAVRDSVKVSRNFYGDEFLCRIRRPDEIKQLQNLATTLSQLAHLNLSKDALAACEVYWLLHW